MSAAADAGGDAIAGGCLCGAVRYRSGTRPSAVGYCHCSQCRIQTGLALAAASVPADNFEVEGQVRWYAASDTAERGFCPTCGTLLFWRAHGADTVDVMAGSLDDQSSLVAERHIFVADKPAWHEIGDGLPRYAASSVGAEPIDPR